MTTPVACIKAFWDGRECAMTVDDIFIRVFVESFQETDLARITVILISPLMLEPTDVEAQIQKVSCVWTEI